MAVSENPRTVWELIGEDSPSNWGKWGPDDEVGSLNYLTRDEVLRGIRAVVSGETFTLQVPIGSPDVAADPVWPNRTSAVRTPTMDEGSSLAARRRSPGAVTTTQTTRSTCSFKVPLNTMPSVTCGSTARSTTATTRTRRSEA